MDATDRAPPLAPPSAPPDSMPRSCALAALSGVLWFLACADFDIWPLAWVAMVPALWVTERAATRRRALFYGWLAGLVANVGGFYWITGLLSRFAHLPFALSLLGLLLLCGYQAIVFLLFAWATRSIRRTSRERRGAALPMALVAPVVMVAFEILVPFIFPWYLAITQAWVMPVIQIAELTGPVGVTALLLAVNGAIHDAISERSPRRRWLPAAGAAGAVALALAFGLVRIGQVRDARDAAPGLMVGVVQGNIAFDRKGLDRADLAARQLADLQRVSAAAERGDVAAVDRSGRAMQPARGAELLVWTESSYPYTVPRDATADFPDHSRARIRREFTAPLVLGALTRDRRDRDAYPYNSALMLDRDGRFTARFDKIFLLVFGEYIPGLETFPFIRKMLPRAAGHMARGEEIVTFPLEHGGATYRLGPMICYEDILPGFGRKLAKLHPHLLVNITNDTWFGDTSEPWEHLALSVYRAVELRTDLVRSVNTGVSAFIDATGEVYAKSYAIDPAIEDRGACSATADCPAGYDCVAGRCNPRGADALLGEVALMGGADGGGHTFYARFGDVFGYLCALAALAAWLVWPRLRRRAGVA
jgi:apolipoprotein N-acyltransferase